MMRFQIVFLMSVLFLLNSINSKPVKFEFNNITVIRNGDSLLVRTSFDETRDLVQYLDVFGTAVIGDNKPMNFKATYLIPKTNPNILTGIFSGGVIIHNTSDDAAPYYFNGNRSGGNLGFGDLRVVTSNSHGKTVHDVGSEWIDQAGVKWYILRIVNTSALWMLSENIGSGDIWDFKTVITGNLTHSRNAVHTSEIIINSYAAGQLEPSVSNQTKTALLNGSAEILVDGVYYCDSLTVKESFWVPDLSASLDSVKTKSGSSYQPPLNLGVCHVETEVKYDFDKYGGCSIESHMISKKPLAAPFWGNIQSQALVKGNYDSIYVYMPNVKPVSDGSRTWDLNNLTDFSVSPVVNLSYYKTDWENSKIPPYRMVQYIGNDRKNLDVGFSHGYSQTYGNTVPKYRKDDVTIAWTLSTLKKSFPYSLFTSTIVPEGFEQRVISFRCYFKPKRFSDNAKSVYWYKEKGYNTFMVDYQGPAINDTIRIPDEFGVKGLSVVDKSNSLIIASGDSIVNNQIVIASEEERSYAVLRLFDFIPDNTAAAESLYIRLPEYIYTTTTSKYAVYYNNVILTKNPEDYSFMVDCPVGYQEGNKYNLDSLNEGIYDFRLEVRDLFGNILESGESKIIVTESSINYNDTLRLLFVGDSKTYSGRYQREMQLMFDRDGGPPIKLLGTQYNVNYPEYGVDNNIYHEGIPGFTWLKFAGTNESSFVFEEGNYWEVYPDCKRYFSELLAGEKPDFVIFLIGLCDIFPCSVLNIEDLDEVDKIIDDVVSQKNMGKLIDSMEVALPEARFGVSLIPPANVREWAWYYCWGDSAKAWHFRFGQHRLVQRYIDHYKILNKPRFSMMPLYLNFDSFLGYDNNECIHPNSYGVKQESETIYAWIKYQISQWMTEPKNLSIVHNGYSVNLTWDSSAGAVIYHVYRSTYPFEGFVKIGSTNGTSFSDPNISGSNRYFYKITAENSLKK